MSLKNELKRKAFHHLALLYLIFYWLLPRSVCVLLLGIVFVLLAITEFLRVRRPEINAWFLGKFGGIHRESEVLNFSGIYWTLLGCWATMLIFTNWRIVMPALGFLVFGDTAAALCGKKWGKHKWSQSPDKSKEGTAAFALVAAAWALLFVKWPVAVAGAAAGAWIELKKLPGNDNLWIPLLSAAALSVFNLVLGK